MKRLIRKLAWQFNRRRKEDEIREEIAFHLEAEARELDADETTGTTAEQKARKEFGNVTLHREDVRAAWSWRWIEWLGQDLRYAARTARRNPLFMLLAVASLSMGIGANTALFSLFDTMVLSKLQVPAPDELVTFHWVGPNNVRGLARTYGAVSAVGEAGAEFSYEAFQRFRAQNQTLQGIAAFAPASSLNVVADGGSEVVEGQYVSGAYYSVLGVRPALGRLLSEEDDQPGRDAAAVLGYAYWRRRFGGNPSVVGESLLINGLSFTIVGVAPEGATDPIGMGRSDPAISLPLSAEARLPKASLTLLDRPNAWWLLVIGRRADGVTLEQVGANFAAQFRGTSREDWDVYRESDPGVPVGTEALVPDLQAVNGSRGAYGLSQPILIGIAMAGGLFLIVLLVICLNLASLMLSRLAARRQEFGIRRSIGAGPGRIRRQLLTEAAFLALIGGMAGILVAASLLRLMPALLPAGVRSAIDVGRMDPAVFVFSFLLALLTVLVFGLGPSFRASRGTDMPTTHAPGLTRARVRLGHRLLTAEVALSLLLLVGAGLCIRTLGNLRTAPVGFDADDLLVFTTNPRLAGYGEEPSEAQAVYTRVLDGLREVPGVLEASFSGFAPLSGSNRSTAAFFPDGDAAPTLVATLNVHPDFFQTMGIPLLAGRGFDARDTAEAPLVAVVNQAFVRRYLGGGNALGRRFGFDGNDRDAVEVVGVVADARYATVRDAVPPVVFTHDAQYARGSSSRTFEVRTAGSPEVLAPAVRDAVSRIDPRLPVLDLSTFSDHMEVGFTAERIFAWVTTLLSGLALLLSMTGLFGLASYSVAQRTREIGIRMALGARRETVLGQTIRDAIRPVVVGIGIGTLGSIAMTPVLGNLVFGLAPYDPITLGVAALMMLGVAALAAYAPARRAARVDPVVALRSE